MLHSTSLNKKERHRLRELDFLRGIAIILVLFRHRFLFLFSYRMGWIGVDLFFVLSGFLVSGLIFRENKLTGSFRPGTFLVRRGFKIYPLYYFSLAAYSTVQYLRHDFAFRSLKGDAFFIQNYLNGWGMIFPASWSLAVEEHFYFGIALLFALSAVRKGVASAGRYGVEIVIGAVMLLCLALRIYYACAFPGQIARGFTMTHLRIDSLAAGVLISYWFHYKKEKLIRIAGKLKYLLPPAGIALLLFTQFLDPFKSLFVRTGGFTMLWCGFGMILIFFITETDINKKLNRIFSRPVVSLTSRIGVYSYAIYLIHAMVNDFVFKYFHGKSYFGFALYFFASILAGALMTELIEKFFLKIRDRYFPGSFQPLAAS
ncbi:MAG TPA: acyltransferase [Bacteroidia bacterium]|nr:acyltransferase [Bacteroidia bacterium]